MYKFDTYRHTESTSQEHNGVKNRKPREIPINITKLPDEIDDSQYEIQMKQIFQNCKNSDFTIKSKTTML